MGNQQSFSETHQYAVAVTPSSDPQSTATYRDVSFTGELIGQFQNELCENAWHLFQRTVKRYPRRPFLGRRFRNAKGELGQYEWMNYSEAEGIALAFGTSLLKRNLVREQDYDKELYQHARKLKILGLYAKNCVEWFLAEQACNAYGIALCPLYDTLGDDALDYILEQTRMEVALVSFDCFDNLFKVLDSHKDTKTYALKTVILIDPADENARKVHERLTRATEMGASVGVQVLVWHELVANGLDTLLPTPGPITSVNTLCYTSGTTGAPKGVILPHSTVLGVVCGATRGPISPSGYFHVGAGDVILSYLPLAHVFERCVCNVVISNGGSIGLYSGDMAKLLDDIKVLQPTVFLSVPRLFNRINDKIALTLKDKKLPTQILFQQGLNAKVNRRRNDSTTTHKLWDAVVFAKIRSMMGGRLRGMICGGAPLDPVVCERMTAFFAVPLMQGYGLSESFGPCFLMHPQDNMAGPIGGVWPDVEFKLQSVPELDYLVTDKPPRGELCLRGPGMAAGYFLDAEQTKAAWDEEGWFHTGDIVLLHQPSNSVQIIDRKKNIFKLSQGEYVAPEKIEGIYGQALFVSQIFVFGYSHKTALVAIVVPEAECVEKWARENKLADDYETLCKNPALKNAILQEMEAVANKGGLKGFEKAKAIHVTSDAFTIDNNLLTPTTKIKRNEAKHYFQSAIDALYDRLE